jgi:serine/threonine protein kinase
LLKAKRILDALAKASGNKQTLFSGSLSPDEVKWSAVEGSGSRLFGSGGFGSFFTVPAGKLLGKSGDPSERVGVKVGRLGQSEAFIAKKLGQADLGPKLIAAKIINKAVSNSENGTIHNGIMAMGIVPGSPLYKLVGKTINGIHTSDAYWKARSELHKLGISHNDAHRGNVIIDDKGKARFVDLGLARKGWRSALAEAIGGHTGADFAVDSHPRWEMSKVFSRNYSRVKEILRENKFSDSDIKEMGDFGILRTDKEIRESPFGRVSVPLAKQLIEELYKDI